MIPLRNYEISPLALELIEKESNRKYPLETGGVLIGWQDAYTLLIEIAVGPGPKAFHRRNTFKRDGLFSQEKLDQIVKQSSSRWDYIGEWHSHPGKMGPSYRDISSIMRIKIDPVYAIENPALGINIFDGKSWQFRCFYSKGSKFLELMRISI